uniref:Uncharacterized protein n=1 Tax=Cacopsylla melanoneura TaxID=428564 RepID=A0A8D8PSV9_9HEMI
MWFNPHFIQLLFVEYKLLVVGRCKRMVHRLTIMSVKLFKFCSRSMRGLRFLIYLFTTFSAACCFICTCFCICLTDFCMTEWFFTVDLNWFIIRTRFNIDFIQFLPTSHRVREWSCSCVLNVIVETSVGIFTIARIITR